MPMAGFRRGASRFDVMPVPAPFSAPAPAQPYGRLAAGHRRRLRKEVACLLAMRRYCEHEVAADLF